VAEGTIQTLQKNNTKLGSILLAANSLLQKFGIKQPVVFAEFGVESLAEEAIKQQVLYKEISQFPVVERDLAFVTGKNVVYGGIASFLERMKVKYLEGFKLFDIYEGEKLGADKKSFAINFRFINAEKTLTDAEVELAMKAITEKLVKEFDAEIRH
jgi:phenylalanyl-tRNA synthetase beta chain